VSSLITNSADLDTIVANQRRLGARIIWLLLLPFFITAAVVWMFYQLSARLADVEVGTKLVTIERYVGVDRNYPWAIGEYERLARTDGRASILTRLGMLYFLLDPKQNLTIALQKLEMATSADPANWEAYRNLTFIYLATGRTKDAIAAGRKALELNETDANTYNNLAWIYTTSKEFGDLPQAQAYAEKAVALTKEGQWNFLDTLAEVYFRQGDHERALTTLRKAKAVADDPDGATQEIESHVKKLCQTIPCDERHGG
jgi:tetratricopeptide (TPR) repeat protein